MTGNEIIEQLNWRYAVKKFDSSKKISESDWQALEKAAVLTPSSYGMQPWKFLVITDSEVRKKLTPISWNQSQVEDCSHFMVLCGKTTITNEDVDAYIHHVAETRGMETQQLEGYAKAIKGDLVTGARSKIIPEWAARQAYIALGNLMTCAANLNIDTCPMEGIEPDKYDEVLGLNHTGYKTAVALAFGYRSEEDPIGKAKKVRFSSTKVIQNI